MRTIVRAPDVDSNFAFVDFKCSVISVMLLPLLLSLILMTQYNADQSDPATHKSSAWYKKITCINYESQFMQVIFLYHDTVAMNLQ